MRQNSENKFAFFCSELAAFKEAIHKLPPSETKHYLHLLYIALRGKNTKYTRKVLSKAIQFTDAFEQLCIMQTKQDMQQSKTVRSFAKAIEFTDTFEQSGVIQIETARSFAKESFKKLVNHAGTNTFEVFAIQAGLNGLGVVLACLFGISGAICGLIGGFVRGLWNDPARLLHYMFLGIVTGFALGAALGFRSPKKIFKEPVFRQIKFALDALDDTFNRALKQDALPINQYRNEAEQFLLQHHFDNNEMLYQRFLKEKFTFHINTQYAEFLDPTLAGFLGHHFYIQANINNKVLGLEFTPSPSDFEKKPVQSEKREVTGAAFLEIFSMALALKPNHTYSTGYLLTKLKSGDPSGDCKNFVDKILDGTNMEPTKINRFTKVNPVANTISFFVTGLSPFPQTLDWEKPVVADSGRQVKP